ncbi:hypothetical protein [Staphylothermus hellenicus]|uniref:Uncharacterized protein n=1 Tax=Staphylothermus hellenicus (strain DSM 12710 / JCM 10830 / BK20S6-10-b1 / P8) TaxID=591019 RepID=D7D8H0_STAHD|nr:hypothetical protein [Staphylothermus hellenicus]ADI32066.1 hypothetical protein Shell_0960 [Staphylothermus hellenicus DSM 12710]
MSQYVVGGLKIEESRSRRGKHIAKSVAYIYSRTKGFIPVDRASEYVVSREPDKPTYVKGSAWKLYIRLNHGEYVVYGWFVRNFLGKVKGFISVYNYRGELLYRAKYYDGVLRKSIGDPIYAWLIRLFIEKTRLPIKKMRLGDEKI